MPAPDAAKFGWGGWRGRSLAALTWSARTGCYSPPAAWPARAAGPPGCFACQGTGVSISHHQTAPSRSRGVPVLPTPALPAFQSFPDQQHCWIRSRSTTAVPPSKRGADIAPGTLFPAHFHPPRDTHVDRSSHTKTSRVSSMIPMASKVMISSACSTEGPWSSSAGPPPACQAPKKGWGVAGGSTHPLVPLKRVAQLAQHRLRKGTSSALGRGRG